MTAAKWFGVGVRLFGVWECLNGGDELVMYGNAIMRLYASTVTSPNAFLAHAVEHLLAGLFLLFAAGNIVANSYSARDVTKEQSEVE